MGWFRAALRREPSSAPEPDRGTESPSSRRRAAAPERLAAVNFERYLREHPRVVVDVWAPWCVPCRAFSPIFASAAAEWGEWVGFGKVHADHEPSLVTRFGVRSIPSLLFFRDGELVRTETGVIAPDRLTKLLHKVFRDLP